MPGDPTAQPPFGTAREPASRARWTRPPSPALLVGRTEASPGYRRPNARERQRNARVRPAKENVAGDLRYGDLGSGTKPGPEDIRSSELFGAPDAVLAQQMNALFASVAWGSLAKVSRELLGRFLSSGGPFGTGGGTEPYKSKALNEELACTSAFDEYDARFQQQFDARLRLLELDPTSLASKPIEMADIDLSSLWPMGTGLGIAIHRVHAVEARISKYGFDEKAGTWDCLFHYALYEHFGLDLPDVTGVSRSLEGKDDPVRNGVLAWYILQHYRGYRPFVVEANVTRRKRPSEPSGPICRGG